MSDEANELWNQVLASLEGRVGEQMIEKLLRPLEALDAGGGVLLLRAPNDFAREWVTKGYASVIEDQLRHLTGDAWTLHWAASAPREGGTRTAMPPPRPVPVGATRSRPASAPRMVAVAGAPSATAGAASGGIACGLNPRYTFEQFVIGPSNQVAHAMAHAMANPAGRRVGVLFLCGGVGLGKTHLSNAVGHRILEQNPRARIAYVAAETFMNEFVSSIQARRMEEFRGRYRNECDALLIDDVQFFAGKDGTQDEFFHTFNALVQREVPIVVTSDVMPQGLAGMAERLVSRFASGMVAELTAPEMETRVAILRKRAAQEGVVLDDEAAFAIAAAVSSNVRELEGMLHKLSIQAGLARRPVIDGALVREALRIGARPSVTTVEDVQRAVSEHYRIRVTQLTGKDRHRDIALPRQVAMYLARVHLRTSFPQIGAKFGGKDHTTVISAVKKVEKLAAEDATVRQSLESISVRLGFALPARAVLGSGAAGDGSPA